MKRYFIAGLLIWVPLVITIWVLNSIVGLLDNTWALLPAGWQPKQWLGLEVPGLGVLLTLAVIGLTGLLAANFIGQSLLAWWEHLLKRIPLFNAVYASVKQVSDTVLSPTGRAFRQVVLVRFPHQGAWTLGFVTGDAPPLVKQLGADVQPDWTVFVPTAPNPTSGYILWVARQDVQCLPISVDDALKMVVSMGVVTSAAWSVNAMAPEIPAQAGPSSGNTLV